MSCIHLYVCICVRVCVSAGADMGLSLDRVCLYALCICRLDSLLCIVVHRCVSLLVAVTLCLCLLFVACLLPSQLSCFRVSLNPLPLPYRAATLHLIELRLLPTPRRLPRDVALGWRTQSLIHSLSFLAVSSSGSPFVFSLSMLMMRRSLRR